MRSYVYMNIEKEVKSMALDRANAHFKSNINRYVNDYFKKPGCSMPLVIVDHNSVLETIQRRCGRAKLEDKANYFAKKYTEWFYDFIEDFKRVARKKYLKRERFMLDKTKNENSKVDYNDVSWLKEDLQETNKRLYKLEIDLNKSEFFIIKKVYKDLYSRVDGVQVTEDFLKVKLVIKNNHWEGKDFKMTKTYNLCHYHYEDILDDIITLKNNKKI